MSRRSVRPSLAHPVDPHRITLMLPTLVREVPEGPGWIYELKWDGVRVLAIRADGAVTLYGRRGARCTAQYPEVVAAIAALRGGDLALDGEIVALEDGGRASFQRLQRRMHAVRDVELLARRVPVVAYLYDCLVLDGRDVRALPLLERKHLLRKLLRASRGALRYCDHVEGDGARFFAAVGARGLEGIVAKRADAPYWGGRRLEWRKIKCQRSERFVIGGFTDPKGGRSHLGSLHVGRIDGDALVYVGKVGTGLDGAALDAVFTRLRGLATGRCPFTRGDPPRGRGHHWVKPVLVCETRFTEWTEDGRIRQPIFIAIAARDG
jgi:bifunctional non-homologous end joining protein LigD